MKRTNDEPPPSSTAAAKPAKRRRPVLGGDISAELLNDAELAVTSGVVDIEGSTVCLKPRTEEQDHIMKRYASYEQYDKQLKANGKAVTKLRNDQVEARRNVAKWFVDNHSPAAEPKSEATTYDLGDDSWVTVKLATKTIDPLTEVLVQDVVSTMDFNTVMDKVKGNKTEEKIIKSFMTQFKDDTVAARYTYTWDAVHMDRKKLGTLGKKQDKLAVAPAALQELCGTWLKAEQTWRKTDTSHKAKKKNLSDKYEGVEKATLELMKERKSTHETVKTKDPKTNEPLNAEVTLKGGGTETQKFNATNVKTAVKQAIEAVPDLVKKCKTAEGFAEVLELVRDALKVSLPMITTVQVAKKEYLHFSVPKADGTASSAAAVEDDLLA